MIYSLNTVSDIRNRPTNHYPLNPQSLYYHQYRLYPE